jgi:hypothetical protein
VTAGCAGATGSGSTCPGPGAVGGPAAVADSVASLSTSSPCSRAKGFHKRLRALVNQLVSCPQKNNTAGQGSTLQQRRHGYRGGTSTQSERCAKPVLCYRSALHWVGDSVTMAASQPEWWAGCKHVPETRTGPARWPGHASPPWLGTGTRSGPPATWADTKPGPQLG